MASLRTPERRTPREDKETRRRPANPGPVVHWGRVGQEEAEEADHRVPTLRGLHAPRCRHHGRLEASQETAGEN